ncbi:methyltransferase domain-containing protein [Pandoraea fibrosis]|uniref:Methyltransferase domain-containing protein n=1 Tax=Pandoraea fibrosis TaxID=1891094 RepID=A0ABX6HLV4_9BURK|nr:class I SAM-dependent methyltransferase [Pandoraea fibrosis]QHE90957.1 methyltransferase domain-containing protein [Pandoraea fibrosis]QHF11788.1 methyltransferase domain-containing protein [Pandoraea fibrosis]
MTASVNQVQAELWNGGSGSAWVDNRVALDQMFVPLARFLIDRARDTAQCVPSGRLLDVGCGTGGATLALCAALGDRWQFTGADISAPMIDVARSRAAHARAPVEFITADVQTHEFPSAHFDLIVSRLGVMFFDDPVAAFANLRASARPGAALHALAWRSPAENPFMTVAERTAGPLFANLPPRVPGAPGQFGFADREHVERILIASGWTDVALTAVHFECTFAQADLREYASRLGPVGHALARLAPHERAGVIDALVDAYAPFIENGVVRFTSACWHIAARAPDI